MQSIIFRNDDISGSTNLFNLVDIYIELKKAFPDCVIYSGVTVFCEDNNKGSVYGEVPFKNKETEWFYTADMIVKELGKIPHSIIASHGLYHIDHSSVSKDAQAMSILGSCNYLKTKFFIPPFNRFNADTIDICKKHGIEIVAGPQWKSLEYNDFNPDHQCWYFHSWRFNQKSFKDVLCVKK